MAISNTTKYSRYSVTPFKKRKHFFLVLITLISVAFLTFEVYSYLDTWHIINDSTATIINVEIEPISQNNTMIYLHFNMTNPSQLRSVFIRRCNLHVYLNGQRITYVKTIFAIGKTIDINSYTTFYITVNVTAESDLNIIATANETSTWFWFVMVEFFVKLDTREVILSYQLTYEGATVIESSFLR